MKRGKAMRRNNKNLKVARGSLTVEAALVLPVFIYIMIAFLYFLQIIRLQEMLQNAITETGFFTAKYAYVYDYIKEYETEDSDEDKNQKKYTDNYISKDSQMKIPSTLSRAELLEITSENSKSGSLESSLEPSKKRYSEQESSEQESSEQKSPEQKSLEQESPEQESPDSSKNNLESSIEAAIAKTIDSTYYKIKMKDYLDLDILNQFCIKNGFNGIHTNLSTFMEEEDAIDIIVTYDIRLPLLFIHIKDIPMMQRVRMRGWSGHKVSVKNTSPDSGAGDEQMVYITQTGTVYHLYKDCTYLNLSIKEVNLNQVDTLRNESGGKYKKCSICDGTIPPDLKTVYITDTGDRYHWNLSCSGLKRTILTVPIKEVGERGLCRRCGAKE
jgi:hypothetical protein